ncbi:hypothetical protein Droror1_Dr00007818 [Drosera rotundifolia]
MGSRKKSDAGSPSASGVVAEASSISGLREKHQQELKNLKLTTQPVRTLKFFILAVLQYFKGSVAYLVGKGGWLVLISSLPVASGAILAAIEGPHEKHLQEVLQYLRFALWWVALGVASSIGFGSGLHTFVLYLGPHIAFFTIKAMQCGRVDLKSAPYDTIQLKQGPSWLDKDCTEFGAPLFESTRGTRIPLSTILPYIQLEAILWGIGTALGELPPYFISRAARISGSDPMEELDDSDNGASDTRMDQIKCWFASHSQYLNFFTILLLASIPNPLFDIAGIMCGQFDVPFWEFFLATLIGKAMVKTHIQTIFIISVCNNQLLDWVENELIRVSSLVPTFASVLPPLMAKLHSVKDKYMAAPSNIKVKKTGLSFTSIWNSVVLLVLIQFFCQIVNKTAQSFLKKQQEQESVAVAKKRPVSEE